MKRRRQFFQASKAGNVMRLENSTIAHNNGRQIFPSIALWALILWGATIAGSPPAMADQTLNYLKSLNIEDLLDAEVTSVSKKPERLADAAAAVFVITAEDIRRAGVRTIAEALRMAPGIHVAQVDANKWAISSRGFSDTFSNKLLVLMDGRSVYTPLYSGVIWDVQDTLLEDIDRIEVIRGPGATMWGANAVNGVINIITKSSQQTSGALIKAGAGSHEPYNAAVRYGDQMGADGAYRIYAKGFERSSYLDAGGETANDQWKSVRGGFRMDLDLTARDALTIQGDIYRGKEDLTLDLPDTLGVPSFGLQKYEADFSGSNMLARWSRAYGDQSDFSLQLYYDRTERQEVAIEENRDTIDLDFQHRFKPTPAQEVVWGMGYRYTQDDIEAGSTISMIPDTRSDQLYSLFVQDEIMLRENKWWLTLGSKLEHNDYTGYELQPNVRLRWKPQPKQTAWASIARAVRTPSRVDHDVRTNRDTAALPFPPYTSMAVIFGDEDFVSEELMAYEVGYRWLPNQRLSLDLAAFYNQYDHLRTVEPDPDAAYLESDPAPAHLVIPLYFDNKMSGETYGVELAATWQPLAFWKISAGYGWLRVNLRTDDDSGDTVAENEAGFSPIHQAQLRSYLDLSRGWSFDSELYYVDELPDMGVPAYTRLDLRLGWQSNANWEFSFSVENSLDDQHLEFGPRTDIVPSEIPRQFFAQVIWRY
jgi:iron complex outermembrane recepter protein